MRSRNDTKKITKKGGKILNKVLVFVTCMLMIVGIMPLSVFAGTHDNQVHVVVDNNVYSIEDGATWDGTLVDMWVNIDDDSTMMSAVVSALDSVSATQSEAESNYLYEINGLTAGSVSGLDGWMGTLNDWFTNEGFGAFTVENGTLVEGDEIHIFYSLDMGEDAGGSWYNNDKTVKDVTFSEGKLDTAFDKNTHNYTLTVPYGTTGIVVNPTASNKNFQVRTSVSSVEYRRTETIPIVDTDVITVTCGDPSWPSMNGGSWGEADSIPAETYTFNIDVAPQPSAKLDSLVIHTGSSANSSTVLLKNSTDSYSTTNVFSNDTFAYTLDDLSDTVTQLRFQAKAADSGSTVKINYYNAGSKDITWTSGSSKWANCIIAGKNVFTIVVTPAEGSEMLPSTYTFTINCLPSISGLTATADGNAVYMDKTFSQTTMNYTLTIPDDSEYVTVIPTLRNSAYSVTYNGNTDNKVNVKNAEKIDVKVITGSGDNEVTNTYTLNLNKVESANFKPEVTPSDAIISVYDQTGASVSKNTDGSYDGLFGQYDYTYTICKYGYIAATGVVPANGGTIKISLEKADASTLKDVSSAWSNFRNSSVNMGITDAETPTVKEDTTMLWNAKLGTGWSAAPSVQIIVDNSLVVMSGTSIYKLNLETGEILAQGTMVGATNFGYTPATYAEGMIFCPLANGTIQAFNAETLESLWVYKDALKGQSLSPITYSDGCIYTGFWNGETKNANFVCISITDEDATQTNEAKVATWKHAQPGGYYWAGSVVIGDYVFVGTDDGTSGFSGTSYICSYNKKTGEQARYLPLENAGDQRSSIAYDSASGKIYFTTKGGYLFSANVDVTTGIISNLKGVNYNAQSTSTPLIYNGKVYFGTGSGISSSGSSGNFVVADADTLEMDYYIGLKGYPQNSMLMSNAYEDTGYLYFYSTYNSMPGGISMLKIMTDASSANDAELIELYDAEGFQQYCITSIICDEDGTLYYKNDSGNVFAVGVPKATKVMNLIEAIGTVNNESKPAIDKAMNTYNELSDEDKAKITNIDKLGNALITYNNLRAQRVKDLINSIGIVTLDSKESINAARAAYDELDEAQLKLLSEDTLNVLETAEKEIVKLEEASNKDDNKPVVLSETEEFPAILSATEEVKTGDSMNIALLMSFVLVSAAGISATIMRRRKKTEN